MSAVRDCSVRPSFIFVNLYSVYLKSKGEAKPEDPLSLLNLSAIAFKDLKKEVDLAVEKVKNK